MNRLFISLIVLVAVATPVLAQDIVIRVTDIDSARPGNIMAMVFAEAGYPTKHDKALQVQNMSADSSELLFSFTASQSPLAIKVLHDEDENGQTTKNWTGIWPAEGLGFSNGARLRLTGPPSFADAQFDLESVDGAIVVPVIYP